MHIAVPTKRTNAQIPQWVTWSSQLASAVALGPVSSQAFATVSLTLDELGVGTRSLYLGANRGRGQLYPDGSLSTLTLRKAEVSSSVQACPIWSNGSVVHLIHRSGVKLVDLLPGQAVEPVVGPRIWMHPLSDSCSEGLNSRATQTGTRPA